MSFKKLVDAAMKSQLSEDSPPGFKGTVKAMKKDGSVDNPYALGWWMKKKGYKSHKKADGTAKESIRVEHSLHGAGTVEEITESHIKISWDNLQKRITAPDKLALEDAKYLTRLAERYTSDPEEVEMKRKRKNKKHKGKPKMKKKVDESMVAVGMAAIGGTKVFRDDSYDDLEELSMNDLLEDDDWTPPWKESEGDDSGEKSSDSSGLRKAKGSTADYTNVPNPADSILTNQEDQPKYSADPLSTMAGYDAASDGDEPDGDYQDDLLPVDAPATPQVRDLEGSSERHNTRDTGEEGDTSEVDAGDYDEESTPEDNGEDKMSNKNESLWLGAEDLGLNEMDMGSGIESGDGYDDTMTMEHEMGAGEVAFTQDFLKTLLAAVSAQAPDDAKLDALCAGLESAQQAKGDSGLDESDWEAIKAAASEAYSGGSDDMGSDDMGDDYADDDMDDDGMDPEMGASDDMDMEECGGDMEYEDKAPGDGEPAGPEGGQEHEGKTKMFDRKGDQEPRREHGHKDQQNRQRRQARKAKSNRKYGMKEDGSSGTPVGTGSTSGSGGGGQKDLSKIKKYTGKPVGTGTSGAGGSNSNEYGQKPSKDGGSNNVPAVQQGSSLGAADNTFSKGSPAPRRSKPLAAEGRKGPKGKSKIDEAIMLGMQAIPTMNPAHQTDAPDDADWDDEMKTIKRRAGMENWWKD